MKLIFFGTGSFAVPALRAFRERVCLVVTQPDRPSGRGMRVHSSPMKLAAEEMGLAVESPEKSRAPEFVERLRAENADALVVASYGQILSQAVLDSANRGGINLHGSLLPKYRGAAPIQRAILNREPETGITLMQMDKGMDTGDIIAMRSTPIGPDETYGELQDRLATIAAEMAVEWIPKVVAGDYPRVAQDNASATMAPKVEKSEAELSFDRPAIDEYARFRAFTPSPGATLKTNVGMLRISEARNWQLGTRNPEESIPSSALQAPSSEAGTVLQVNPLVIGFAEGAIEFVELQPEGKKRMAGRDFANGQRLKPGMNLRPN
jgi:methionyl-tRNA formyltransferase